MSISGLSFGYLARAIPTEAIIAIFAIAAKAFKAIKTVGGSAIFSRPLLVTGRTLL
jgi:hypothetical protein